jgi:hypothetical protein
MRARGTSSRSNRSSCSSRCPLAGPYSQCSSSRRMGTRLISSDASSGKGDLSSKERVRPGASRPHCLAQGVNRARFSQSGSGGRSRTVFMPSSSISAWPSGVPCGPRRGSAQLRDLALLPHTARRRDDGFELLQWLDRRIDDLDVPRPAVNEPAPPRHPAVLFTRQ